MKTFAEMKANVGLELQDTTSAFASLIGKWLNRRYFQAIRTINWEAINWEYAINTVVGQRDYNLPGDFKSAVYVIDTSNNRNYEEVRPDTYTSDPSAITSKAGYFTYAVIDGQVLEQPTAASAVSVVSTSASDTATTVTIRGISNGVDVSEVITLNGTNGVNGTKSFTSIKAISKEVTVGAVTVTCNSQTIAVISPEVSVFRQRKLRLFGIPTSVVTLSVPYHVSPLPMSLDEDFPVIDVDDALEAGARADGWRYKRQGKKASIEEQIFQNLLADYQWKIESNPNRSNQFRPVPYKREW